MSDVSDVPEHTIRRILVATDASPHSEAALETAARFAAAFEAELRGIFVEDINLLRSAALPVAREVRSFALPAQTMSTQRIDRQLKRQADQARRALERAARHTEVEHAFTVARGRVSTKLLEAAAETDLVLLGKASAARCSRRKLGSTAREVLLNATTPVLVLREALEANVPIIAYYDGSAAAERALALAVTLARGGEARWLTVLLPGDDAGETQRLRDAVTEQYGQTTPPLHIRSLTRIEAMRLATIAPTEGQGLVVLPAASPPLRDADVQQFLYELDRPVLVIH